MKTTMHAHTIRQVHKVRYICHLNYYYRRRSSTQSSTNEQAVAHYTVFGRRLSYDRSAGCCKSMPMLAAHAVPVPQAGISSYKSTAVVLQALWAIIQFAWQTGIFQLLDEKLVFSANIDQVVFKASKARLGLMMRSLQTVRYDRSFHQCDAKAIATVKAYCTNVSTLDNGHWNTAVVWANAAESLSSFNRLTCSEVPNMAFRSLSH